ncbi:hypothetical protein Bca52824_047639 [Brassica carinata]|uniref:Uncharacterized protein n=1 Tax=Brassica carinata TaxID=52824 RepID=A0A8X7RGZ8_BRACI|nr:hypothetical protein Bca52824_047639 [Brassica carinata]
MSSKLLLDQSSEIVSQQICIGKMHLQPQGSDRLHLPHMETRATLLNKRENAVVNTFLVVYSRSESHYCIVGYVGYDVEAALDSWQKLLDFGEVKRSYISFFDIEKHETVNSRWDLELGQEQMRFDIGKEKEVKIVKKCLG